METGERSVYLVCTGPRTAIINKNFHVPENFLIHVSQHHYNDRTVNLSYSASQYRRRGEDGGFVHCTICFSVVYQVKENHHFSFIFLNPSIRSSITS